MELDSLQIEVPNTDTNTENVQLPRIWEKKYYNSSKDLVLGFNPLSEDALAKKAVRAKRFGIKRDNEEEQQPENPFMKIDLQSIRWPPPPNLSNGTPRPESLLLYGVQDMSTKDIFSYFKLYGPDTVEWIDDFSCNVVWEFASAAATALKAVSMTYDDLRGLQIRQKEGFEESIHPQSEPTEEQRQIWRIALPSSNAAELFLRQSSTSDRKLPGAAQRSYYYLKYGKDGNSRGLVSASRKRKLNQLTQIAAERMDPAEPDVKFMEIDSEGVDRVGMQDMEVDSEHQPSGPKRGRIQNSRSMYSDRTDAIDGDVFGRLGQQDRGNSENIDLSKGRKSIHDRLGPINKGLSMDDRPTERAPPSHSSPLQTLDLRSKLKRNKQTQEDSKLLNLCIEITEVNKEKRNNSSREWKRNDKTVSQREEIKSSSSSDDSDSDSDSDSDNGSEEESKDTNAGAKAVKEEDEEGSSDSDSSSSSSSSSDEDEDDSDSNESGDEEQKRARRDSSSSSSSDSDTDSDRQH